MLPSPDRWKRLEALFYESLELKPEARAAFLEESCGPDKQLREEVEALLQELEAPMDLLQQPVLEAVRGLVGDATPRDLAPGTNLNHYRILSLLATGGMGRVYLAEDTALKRKVAVKVLAPAYLHDEHGLRRFQREAEAASALNHPNIVTIYGCGHVDELHFIVSEFVDGTTLRQKLSNGRLDLNTTLDIAIQIAKALEVAHSAGIIHRDIKPENVMVRNDGLVKVLDFGIAKLSRARRLRQTTDAQPSSITEPGVLMGTVAYMSPEQATGKELDARTDLFSFGVVLYEMTTGEPPFPGQTVGVVLEKILTQRPAVLPLLNSDIPVNLGEIVNKALQKNRTLRYQHATEMRADLQQLKQAVSPLPPRLMLVKQPATASASQRLPWISGAALVFAIALMLGYWASRRNPKLTDKDTVVLSDFSNATQDPVFNGTLRQGLSAQLDQSPFLNLLSDERIAHTLSSMAHSRDAKLTPDLAREVCQRTASVATIDGSIASLGSQYVIGLKAVNCHTGDMLAEEQVTANGKEQVLRALGQAATKLRQKLGESLASLQTYDTPLEDVTTTSLEALQAYSLSSHAFDAKSDFKAAIPLLQQAISLDPNFAMAYARLGVAYHNMGQTERAADNLKKAYDLRDRVSTREKLYIDSRYQHHVTGNLAEARKTYELWVQAYPRDKIARDSLAVISTQLGDYNSTLKDVHEELRDDQGNGVGYLNLASTYLNLNQLKEAMATATEAQSRNLNSAGVPFILYAISFLQGDEEGMERAAAAVKAEPGWGDLMLSSESHTAAYYGQFGKARDLSSQAIAAAKHSGSQETAAGYHAAAALRESLVGDKVMARQGAETAMALSKGRDIEALCAVTLAMSGYSSLSTQLTDALAHRFPEDTIVQFLYLPTARAAVLLESGQPEKAVQVLASALPYELGGPDTVNFTLYPAYVRGEALLRAHRGDDAAVEFQKIADHPGVVRNQLIGALARLGLGRAYALSEDEQKAKAAYRDFLTLWKNADQDIPILKQGKAEYAKLQ